MQLGGFHGGFFGSLLKVGLPWIKNVLQPLAKRVFVPLGLITAASAADSGIHKKISGSGTTVKSNEEMKDIMKIVKSLEGSELLLTRVTKTTENEKRSKVDFLVCS